MITEKEELIFRIKTGTQKEAECAIDLFCEKVVIEFVEWRNKEEKKYFQGKLSYKDWYDLTFSQRFKKFLNDKT